MAALDYIDPDLPDYPSLPYRLTDEGFAVEDTPPDDPECIAGFAPLKFIDVYAYEAANFAVTKFNELKGTDLTLAKVVRGNWVPDVFEPLYFLTLECVDGRFYEVKIFIKKDLASSELIIFRPAKFYKREDQKTDGGGVQKTGGEGVEETDGGGVQKTDGEGVEETDGEGVEETDGGDRENYAQGLVEHKRLKKSM